MYVKKIFLFFVTLFLLTGTLFSDDFNITDINGVWMTNSFLELSLNQREERWRSNFRLWDNWFIIFWDDTAKKGVFQTGSQVNVLCNIEVIGKNGKKMIIKFTYDFLKETTYEEEIVLEYVSRDSFRILSSPYLSNPDYLYRIGDFAKKPQAKGITNDYGVRFRNRPELSSGVWFNLDFGEELEIIGMSAEKQIIGELESYWYEVRLNFPGIIGDGCLDGWVFGAYLDVENRAELEEKLKKLRRDGG